MSDEKYHPVKGHGGSVLIEVPLVEGAPITGDHRLVLDGVVV
jgi:hypothetical protein